MPVIFHTLNFAPRFAMLYHINTMDQQNEKSISETEFHETLGIMAEQVSQLPTREEMETRLAQLPTREEVTKIVKETVREIVKEESNEQFSHLPSKEEFYASQDLLIGELKAIRQEQVMFHHALQRHEGRITRLEDHTGIGQQKW